MRSNNAHAVAREALDKLGAALNDGLRDDTTLMNVKKYGRRA